MVSFYFKDLGFFVKVCSVTFVVRKTYIYLSPAHERINQ